MIDRLNLRNARLHINKTQAEVARAVGVSLPGYRLWEQGGAQPNYKNEKRLRDYFEKTGGSLDANSKPTKTRV